MSSANSLSSLILDVSTKTKVIVRESNGLGIFEGPAYELFESEFMSNHGDAEIVKVRVVNDIMVITI